MFLSSPTVAPRRQETLPPKEHGQAITPSIGGVGEIGEDSSDGFQPLKVAHGVPAVRSKMSQGRGALSFCDGRMPS